MQFGDGIRGDAGFETKEGVDRLSGNIESCDSGGGEDDHPFMSIVLEETQESRFAGTGLARDEQGDVAVFHELESLFEFRGQFDLVVSGFR